MRNRIIIYFLVFAAVMASCGKSKHLNNAPKAENGTIDIRAWDFENKGSINLNGQWDFYWKALYTPNDLKNNKSLKKLSYNVPGYWNTLIVNKEKVGGEGFGTFSLKIIHNKNQYFDLFIDEQMTAYKFWCNDELIYECGVVADNAKNAVPREYPITKTILLSGDTTNLVFQISNFHHRVGGFFKSPELGLKQHVFNKRIFKFAFDLFLFGSILIMSFYHFGIYVMRKKAQRALFFGLFTLVLAVRTLFTGSQFITVIFPDIGWAFKYRVEYLTLAFAPMLVVVFLYHVYKEDISKKVTQAFVGVCLAYSLTTIFPPYIFTRLLLTFQIIILIGIFYYFTRLIKTVQRRRHGARILFTTLIILFLTLVNDILYTRGVITWSTELVPFGTFIFILGQSLVLAKVFTGTFYANEELTQKLDYQNQYLEQLVQERTKEIEYQQQKIIEKSEELRLQNEEIHAINENLQEQKGQVEKNEAKIRGLVELLPVAIFELDKNGNVLFANSEFYNRLGVDNEPDKNINIDDFIVRKKGEEDISFIERIRYLLDKKKIVQELEFKIRNTNGENYPILLSLSLAPESTRTAYRCGFIDISQRAEYEKEIKKALKENKKKNKDITASITYALNIQKALLPSDELIGECFEDYFIINKPHSIVSGDFYYFEKKRNKVIFALADCTGHGVPGGFMTMLGITLLNDIYHGDNIPKPNEALDLIRSQIISSLDQTLEEESSKDGMDMILCILDLETLILEFASAGQPLYVARNDELISFKGDKMPVSIYRRMKSFTYQQVQLQKGDILYLFTDGIVDLFGGPNDRRLYAKGLQRIISDYSHELLSRQAHSIDEKLIEWQGDNKQTDDMLMLGLKI